MSKQTEVKQTGANIVDALRALLREASNTQTAINKASKLVKDSKDTISGKLLAIAKECSGVEQFLNACELAETEYKGKANGKKANAAGKGGTIPQCWTQAKSNIKQGWNKGIAPADFETESEFRKALNEKRKADKAEQDEQESNVTSVTMPKPFRPLVMRMLQAYELDENALNALANDMFVKLDAIINAAMPKGEPVQGEQQQAA